MSYLHLTALTHGKQPYCLLSLTSPGKEIRTLNLDFEIDEATAPFTVQHTFSRMVKEAVALCHSEVLVEHTPNHVIVNASFEDILQTVKILKGHPNSWVIRQALYQHYNKFKQLEIQRPHAAQNHELLNWLFDACILTGTPIDIFLKGAHLYQTALMLPTEEQGSLSPLIVQTLYDYINHESAFTEEKIAALFMLAEHNEDVYARLQAFFFDEECPKEIRHSAIQQIIEDWLASNKVIENTSTLTKQVIFYEKAILPQSVIDSLKPEDFNKPEVQAFVKYIQQHFLLRYCQENIPLVLLGILLLGGFIKYGISMAITGIMVIGIIGAGIALYSKFFKKSDKKAG
jgi:hypothetical protein